MISTVSCITVQPLLLKLIQTLFLLKRRIFHLALLQSLVHWTLSKLIYFTAVNVVSCFVIYLYCIYEKLFSQVYGHLQNQLVDFLLQNPYPLLLTFLLVDVINTYVEKVEPLLLLIVYIRVTQTVPGSLKFLEDIISTWQSMI